MLKTPSVAQVSAAQRAVKIPGPLAKLLESYVGETRVVAQGAVKKSKVNFAASLSVSAEEEVKFAAPALIAAPASVEKTASALCCRSVRPLESHVRGFMNAAPAFVLIREQVSLFVCSYQVAGRDGRSVYRTRIVVETSANLKKTLGFYVASNPTNRAVYHRERSAGKAWHLIAVLPGQAEEWSSAS